MKTFWRSLAYSWAYAREFFNPAYLHTFFLIVLRMTRDIYSTLFFSAWWALAFFAAAWFLFPHAIGAAQALLVFVMVCIARSSVGIKNSSYLFEKIARYFIFYLIAWYIPPHACGLFASGTLGWYICALHTSLLLILYALFLIDDGPPLDAFFHAPPRTTRMLLYNYPLFLGLGLLGLLIAHVFGVLAIPLIPVYIAAIVTIYIQRVYDQGIYY
jgi:hypothetical protein